MNRINLLIIITMLLYSNGNGQQLINEILSFGTVEYSSVKAEEYLLDAEILKNDYGLTFNASAQHRFGEGFIEGDLTENNGQTFYKAGVSWDLLKGGWLYNQSEAKQFGLRAQLELAEEQQELKKRAYFAQYSYAAFLFDEWILDIYLSRENFLKAKKPLFSSLSKDGYFTKREQLELDSRFQEVMHQIKNISHSNRAFISIFGNPLSPPDILPNSMPDIEIAELLEDLNNNQSLLSIMSAQKGINEKSGFWTNEVSIKASLNYNHQVSFIDLRRDFVSAGISVSIPVYRSNGLRNQRYELADKKIEEDYEYEIANLKKELLMLYQEYAYKQKQLVNTHLSVKILEEKIRVQNVQKISVNADLPTIDASLLKDDLFSVKIEQITLCKQMSQLLIRMNTLLPDSEISDYLMYKYQPLMSSLKEVE